MKIILTPEINTDFDVFPMHIPELDSPVQTATAQNLTVVIEPERMDNVSVTFELFKDATRSQVPELYLFVLTGWC